MGLNTLPLSAGALVDFDLVSLGASTGLLWRSGDVTLVGMGAVDEVSLSLSSGAADLADALESRRGNDELQIPGSGPIAFSVLAFDPSATGVGVVPEIVIGEVDGQRFMTAPDSLDVADLEARAAVAIAEAATAMPGRVQVERGKSAVEWRDQVVTVARDRLRASEMRKAVFARELVLKADSAFPLARVVRDLDRRFPEAMVFAIDGFIGASPELLASRFGRTVRAHPLAGTASRSTDPQVDAERVDALRSSSKDRTEHQITIDWLLAELLPFCSYVDAEPEPSVLSMANVHHLGTMVEGVLSTPPVSAVELVAGVHPTPALGGDPQAEALELIAELEGFDRSRYGGPAGWVDSVGNGEFAVSVRTAQVDGHQATVCAGVGVVAQSDPEAELVETQAKFRAMLGSLLNPQ